MVTLNFVIRPMEYEGLMIKLLCEVEKHSAKNKERTIREWTVLAAGGRYDGLIDSFRKPAIESVPPTSVGAVGISLAMDKLVSLLLEQRKDGNLPLPQLDPVEVLLCSVGEKNLLKEKLGLLKELWTSGVRADSLQDPVASLADLEDHCKYV